jgi:hypothetical protein
MDGDDIMITKFLRKLIQNINTRNGHCGSGGGAGHCS